MLCLLPFAPLGIAYSLVVRAGFPSPASGKAEPLGPECQRKKRATTIFP